MKNIISKRRILYILIAALVLIQFSRIDKTNPPVDAKLDFINMTNPPVEVAATLKNACYDCHSHETAYPWYTNVAPLSWWIKGHINGGLKHLNLSTWGNYDAKKKEHKMDEAIEYVEKKWMPLSSYTWLHPEAKLTDDQRTELIGFFKLQMTK